MVEEEFSWDKETYTPGAGGDFIKPDDFDRLRLTDAVVLITGIREGISNYDPKQPKEQWLVDFITADGEEYTKGMTKGNEERDDRIKRVAATIEATGEPKEVSFIKVGKRYDIVKPKGTFGG
jgi:hypothetical protein